MSSGDHNLKLNDRSSYFTTFMCHYSGYRYKRLPFGVAPIGNMFQHKIDEIFRDLPNVFGFADDMLVVGYDSDGKDHNETIWQVLQICRNVNLKQGQKPIQVHFSSIL